MKSSLHRPPILAWGLALLIAACVMLLSTSGAQAAANRGAVLVKDIRPGRSGSISITRHWASYVGGQLTNVSGTLYFSADDGRHGHELWRSDGTARGRGWSRTSTPAPARATSPGSRAVGRTLYFSADDGVHGVELWRSDGTGAGTRMVKDINPGSRLQRARLAHRVGGTLYFAASDGTHASELWRSDGTEAGTTLVKKIVGFGIALTDVNGTLYFAGRRRLTVSRAVAQRRHRGGDDHGQGQPRPRPPRRSHRRQRHPLLRAPTTASTAASCGEATAPRRARPWSRTFGPSGSSLRPHRRQRHPLLRRARTASTRTQLWRSDGTEAGTTMVMRPRHRL